ncbi:MAG: hypothetical protein KAJ10_11355, partial [Thermodesulfovibrionia bacterium]|nr:hypothetical protein [Thermodesulfovibrionia bacterium]
TTWNAISSTPVTVDIDLSGHADWGSAGSELKGLGIVGDALPEEVILSAQLQSGGWVVLETLNFAVNHAVYLDAGNINGGPYNKLRFTLTNPTAPAAVRIDQMFARFENSSQGAYLPTVGGTIYGDVALEGITTSSTQPAFLAYNATSDTNVTGDGTLVTPVNFDTEVFDQDGNFSGDTFTAPVAGRYLFEISIEIAGLLSAHTSCDISLNTSNRNFFKSLDSFAVASSAGVAGLSFSVVTDMDVNDTAVAQVKVSNGTKVVDITGAGSGDTSFSGALLT